jgi:hypothetical protein
MTVIRVRAIDANTDEYVVRANIVSFMARKMQKPGVGEYVTGTRLYLADGRTIDIPSLVEEIVKAMADPPPKTVG